jgi:hypothetical protein
MAATAETRETTFKDGAKFIEHIDSVDDLYTAVITDIVNRSFVGIGWIVDTKKVDRTGVLAPIFADKNTYGLPSAISKFDDQTSPASDPNPKAFSMTRVAMSDFHYAWTGDEMAYIDRVASALFMQQQ